MSICHHIISDSGGVLEKIPSSGKHVLDIRDTTGRPEAIAAGTSKLVGTNAGTIVTESNRLLDDAAYYYQMSIASNPFGEGNACSINCEDLNNSE